MSKEIPLSQGQVALVDDDDYERLIQWEWCAKWDPSIRSFYAVRHGKTEDGKRPLIPMAREIMHAQPGQEVDHRDHNTLDNRKANLRLCTHSENQHNQRKHKKGSSRHKGVHWRKDTRKWQARIKYKSQRIHLGYYNDEDDAGRAYNKAAIKYFGEFAYLNVI